MYSVLFENAKFDVRQRFVFCVTGKGLTRLKTVSFSINLN
jgi:hypothetical protein